MKVCSHAVQVFVIEDDDDLEDETDSPEKVEHAEKPGHADGSANHPG